MSIRTRSKRIITHDVLNRNTGEFESIDFKEEHDAYQIRGGYSRMYKAYDEVVSEVITSNLDAKLLVDIKNKFTYKQTDVALSATKIAKQMGTSRQKVTKFIATLVLNQFLGKVDKGLYRLNPYVYLPYNSDAEALQKEWDSLMS